MSSNQSAQDQEKNLQAARAGREADLLEQMAKDLWMYVRLQLLTCGNSDELMLDTALGINRKSIAVKALERVRSEFIPVVPEPKG